MSVYYMKTVRAPFEWQFYSGMGAPAQLSECYIAFLLGVFLNEIDLRCQLQARRNEDRSEEVIRNEARISSSLNLKM